jgi:signal transduction histidine kinase
VIPAASMNPLRRALVGLALAGFVLGVLMAVVVLESDHEVNPGVAALLSLVVGWSFLGAGLLAWERRPDNLTGPLMVLVAFTWFLAQLVSSDLPGLMALGYVVRSLPFAVLIHMLFAYPSGRLERIADRRLVALAYFDTLALSAVTALMIDPARDEGCEGCPANPLLVWNDETLLGVVQVFQTLVALVVIGALIRRFVERRRAAVDEAQRKRDAPVWWAGGGVMVLLLAVLLSGFGPEDGNYDDYIYYVVLLALALVPYAFWVGLLRSRLTEADVVAEENVRLDAELQARLDELQESRARIVEAGYAERRRVERDLHDGAQQRLVALGLQLQVVRARIADDPEAAAALLTEAGRELSAATEELRELARGIHPPVLTDRGLIPALEALASRSPLPVEIETRERCRASEAVEAAAYFVVSEALTNVARHAQAERATVRVGRVDSRLEVEVQDDGRGGADLAAGSGLRGLADRVGALGGTLAVSSDGGGTTVRVSLPARG